MTIGTALSQSQSDFSVPNKRLTPSWNDTRSLLSRPLIKKQLSSFHKPPPRPVWTVPGTKRQSVRLRKTRTPAQRPTTGTERVAEECWRSWSRGAVSRRSGLWSLRMNSGLWAKISPRTTSWVCGLSPRVCYVELTELKSVRSHPLNGHHVPNANCG